MVILHSFLSLPEGISAFQRCQISALLGLVQLFFAQLLSELFQQSFELLART